MNATTLEKLEQLILKPSNLQNQVSAHGHLDTLDRSFATRKRLLLKKGRTFGFTIKRWYTIVGFELLLFPSKTSHKPKKIKPLRNARIRLDGKIINKEKYIGLSLSLADQTSVWIAVDSELERQQLIVYLNPAIIHPLPPKAQIHESRSMVSLEQDMPDSKIINPASDVIISLAEDADVHDDFTEETSFAKTVGNYSLSITKLKTEIETLSKLTSDRKILMFREPVYSVQTLENNEKGISLLGRMCSEQVGIKRAEKSEMLGRCSSSTNKTFPRLPLLEWQGAKADMDSILDSLAEPNSQGEKVKKTAKVEGNSSESTQNEHNSPQKKLRVKTSHKRSLSQMESTQNQSSKNELTVNEQIRPIEQLLEGSLNLDKENTSFDFTRFPLLPSAIRHDPKAVKLLIKAQDDSSPLSATLNKFGPHVSGNTCYFDQFKNIGAEDAMLSQTILMIPETKDLTEDYKISSSLDSKKTDVPSESSKKLTIGLPPERRFGLKKSLLTKLACLVETRSTEKSDYDSSKLAEMSADDALGLMQEFRIKEAKEVYKRLSTADFRHRLSLIECDLLLLGLKGSRKELTEVLGQLTEFAAFLSQQSAPSKKNANDFVNHEVMRAECSLIKSFVNGILGNKLQFILYVSESWSIFKKLDIFLENKKAHETVDSSNRNRVLFGTGLFNLVFSLIPSNLLKFMRIIGFAPNRAVGVKKLEKCWKNNIVRSPHAAVLLCIYHLEFGSEVLTACKIVESALMQYSYIPYFLWLGAVLSWKFCQNDEAKIMLKLGIKMCKQQISNPIYFNYEIGCNQFLSRDWEKSKKIFEHVARSSIRKEFLETFDQEFAKTLHSLKSKGIATDVQCQPFPIELNDDSAIFPHSFHTLIKIAACCYELKNEAQCRYWLVAALVVHKKQSNIKTKNEEEFVKLTERFLKRKSLNMLTFELYYFLKHLPKLPDYALREMVEASANYLEKLQKENSELKGDVLGEFMSGMLIIVTNNCLMGETALAISDADKILPLVERLDEDYKYLGHHLLYWLGRGLIIENRLAEGQECFKRALRWKKCLFSISDKIKTAMQQKLP